MNRIKITDNFYLDEFIDPITYSERGERSIQLMDMRIILAIQHLREVINKPITINNWSSRGQFRESGLRRADTRTGARWSQHKYGRALDFRVSGMTPREVHQVIHQHQQTFIERQWLTTLEDARDTPSWTHIDCRYTGKDSFLIVRP